MPAAPKLRGGGREPTQSAALAYRCCAGKAAVDKWYGWKAKSDDNWKASKDHAEAFAAALQLSDNDAEAAELLVKWAERRADVVVEQQWPQIHRVAFALLEHDQLSGEQVAAILNGSNGSAPNAAAKMSGGGKSGDSQRRDSEGKPKIQ